MPLAASGAGSPKGKGKKSKKAKGKGPKAKSFFGKDVLSLVKMFACAVTKPAIERPTALNPGALRHRAPARNVSLILIPW